MCNFRTITRFNFHFRRINCVSYIGNRGEFISIITISYCITCCIGRKTTRYRFNVTCRCIHTDCCTISFHRHTIRIYSKTTFVFRMNRNLIGRSINRNSISCSNRGATTRSRTTLWLFSFNSNYVLTSLISCVSYGNTVAFKFYFIATFYG